MSRWKVIFRKTLLILSATAGVSCFVLLLTSAVEKQTELTCTNRYIHIDFDSGLSFLTQKEIEEKIDNLIGKPLQQQKLSEINLQAIETMLEKQPYVDSAEVYFNQQRAMVVNVKQKRPILRIINNDGVGYYLSDKSETMPLSNSFTPRVLVATGVVQSYVESKRDSLVKVGLCRLVEELEKDTFLNALTNHLNVLENGEVELIPVIGNQIIQLGKPMQNTENKLQRIKIFYTEALPRLGWSRYKTVNVKFDNQVVCQKAEVIDSTTLNTNIN